MARLLWGCLVFFVVFAPCTLLAAGQESDALPVAAGMCANKAAGLMEKGNYAKAVQEIESFQARAGTVDPDTARQKGYTHYYLDFLVGNCCMMMEKQGDGYVKKAASAYARAVKKHDGFYQGWLNLGQCRYTLKQMDKAARAFIRGYDAAPEKKGVYLYQAAACYYFNADYPNALDTFNRLLKNHPADVTLEKKEVLVNILFALKKNRQALPYLKELAAKSKGDKKRTWQEVLLYQYMELGMDEQAVSYARTLTRQEPEEPKWWRALANIHLNKNCLEKGLEAFMIYSFTTPLSASETKLLADLYAGCNIPLEAARVYEAWLKKVQKDPEGLQEFCAGPTAIALSGDDPVAPAKILSKFAKEIDAFELKAGVLSGKLMSVADITALAELPSREELLAKALSCMNAPASNFVGTLAAIPRSLVQVLNAIGQSKAA